MQKRLAILAALLVAGVPAAAVADETSKPGAGSAQAQKPSEADKKGSYQIESGARQIGEGAREAAKGVAEGAKEIGRNVKDAANEAKPQAKNAWESFKTSAVEAGRSVKTFFKGLFRD